MTTRHFHVRKFKKKFFVVLCFNFQNIGFFGAIWKLRKTESDLDSQDKSEGTIFIKALHFSSKASAKFVINRAIFKESRKSRFEYLLILF